MAYVYCCLSGDFGYVLELLDRTLYLSLGEGEYGVTDMLYEAARSKSSEVLLVFGEGEYGGAHWGYTFSLQVGDDEQDCSCADRRKFECFKVASC